MTNETSRRRLVADALSVGPVAEGTRRRVSSDARATRYIGLDEVFPPAGTAATAATRRGREHQRHGARAAMHEDEQHEARGRCGPLPSFDGRFGVAVQSTCPTGPRLRPPSVLAERQVEPARARAFWRGAGQDARHAVIAQARRTAHHQHVARAQHHRRRRIPPRQAADDEARGVAERDRHDRDAGGDRPGARPCPGARPSSRPRCSSS